MIDLDAIKARLAAASDGPWERGDVWLVAGVLRDDTCTFCRDGEPVRRAKADINGELMDAHWHRAGEPYAYDWMVSGPLGLVVDEVFDEGDLEFVVHARRDIPELVAEVERLRALLGESAG